MMNSLNNAEGIGTGERIAYPTQPRSASVGRFVLDSDDRALISSREGGEHYRDRRRKLDLSGNPISFHVGEVIAGAERTSYFTMRS